MQKLERLMERILRRVNINLRGEGFDAGPFLKPCVPLSKLSEFYAFYGVTAHHPLHFHFNHSSLAGSYFLGKCRVDGSILYKSDIRGDELKSRGESFHYRGLKMAMDQDESISISDSMLIKTLVHNKSHDPENPELFLIRNSAACPFANIHGSPLEGSFLGAFATADLTTLHSSILGHFAYVQAGELWHQRIEPGHIWINQENSFDFRYQFPQEILEEYVHVRPGDQPQGRFMDFLNARKEDFRRVFDVVHLAPLPAVPRNASVSRYAVIKPKTRIGANVLIAQRAYVENSFLGKGSNAQENCFIINSQLEGNDITAHGAKLINTRLAEKVFVGFNSFLHGLGHSPLVVGKGSIIMPHTIIDLKEPVSIPSDHLVWGYISKPQDLRTNSRSLAILAATKRMTKIGRMEFAGSGSKFVAAFRNRTDHILEANGAYFDGRKNKGHAQKGQSIAYNIIQPYPIGVQKGIYPTIHIEP
ncbi:MAG: transferase [Deltaproteobacteria bacterium]|nr:transferase [Deltaproteobacteria bacterium]